MSLSSDEAEDISRLPFLAGDSYSQREDDADVYTDDLVLLSPSDLPNDLFVAEILPHLTVRDLSRISLLNRRFHSLATCDVLWLKLRERLFKRPEEVTENVYQTFVQYHREIGQVGVLFSRIPCVYSMFYFLFGMICILFFGLAVFVAIGAGFPWFKASLYVFIGIGDGGSILMILAVAALLGGIEFWVCCFGFRMARVYNRLKGRHQVDPPENPDPEIVPVIPQGKFAGVQVMHRFTGIIGGGTPEENPSVHAVFGSIQAVLWGIFYLPCVLVAALLAITLRLTVPGFETRNLTYVVFLGATILHECILIILLLKIGISFCVTRKATNWSEDWDDVKNIVPGGCCLNWGMKFCFLLMLIPLSLAADGLFSQSWIPLILLPCYIMLLCPGCCVMAYAVVGLLALCVEFVLPGAALTYHVIVAIPICCGGLVCCLSGLTFIFASIIWFGASLEIDRFWCLFPLLIVIGLFTVAVVVTTVFAWRANLKAIRENATRGWQEAEYGDDPPPPPTDDESGGNSGSSDDSEDHGCERKSFEQ